MYNKQGPIVSIENYIQCSMVNYNGKEYVKKGHIYIYIYIHTHTHTHIHTYTHTHFKCKVLTHKIKFTAKINTML